MTSEEFDAVVDESLESIPGKFRDRMKNLSVIVQNWPTDAQLKSVGMRPGQGLLFGLYSGVPRTKGGHYAVKLPDQIILFRLPLMMVSKTESDLKRNIRSTVLHEVGHHFGMSESEIRDALNSHGD
ncbi:metallopeptidase family protein [Patescibacteria group bacterium]